MSLMSTKGLVHSRLIRKSDVSPARETGRGQLGTAVVPRPRRRRGFSAITVALLRLLACGTSPGRPRGLLKVWPVWERIAHHLWPTSILPATEFGVLEFRLVSYQGRPLQLPGYGVITSGALVGELHCNNQNLLKALTFRGASPLRIGRSELRCLARWAMDADPAGNVVAFYGTTYMALMRFGFTRYDHPAGARAWMDQLFMIGLLALYNPDGVKRLRRGRIGLSSSPPQMWISRRELLRLYGPTDKQVIDRPSPFAESSPGLP